MDSPPEEKKVHDIYPDHENVPHDQLSTRRTSITGHYARPRPFRIPRHVSQSYPAFKAKQECALKISINELEQEMGKSTGIARLELTDNKLMIHHHSQSKLSQQELADLQKATHFDKKELQQWYKGESMFVSQALSRWITES